MTRQKAYLIQTSPTAVHGLDDLNIALERGWRVASTCPLGGAAAGGSEEQGFSVGCLVIVERNERHAPAVIDTIEEEVDELLEGDGANADVDAKL